MDQIDRPPRPQDSPRQIEGKACCDIHSKYIFMTIREILYIKTPSKDPIQRPPQKKVSKKGVKNGYLNGQLNGQLNGNLNDSFYMNQSDDGGIKLFRT
jgi:hypothetical protein